MPALFHQRSRQFRAALLRALALGCVALLASACGPRTHDGVPVVLTLDHRFGDEPIVLGSGRPISVSRLSYYLGLFRMQRADGNWIASPARDRPEGDYVRVDLADPSTLQFEPLRVPVGDYRALEFLIGVDAQRNGAGALTGALDPEHGLFWTWNTGYIFFALEGRASDHALTFHLGGDSRLARTVVLPVTLHATHAVANVPVRLRVDLAEFFRDLPPDRMHAVMSAQASAPLADRYADLFSVAAPQADAVQTARAP
jgi:hypothetical protein